MIHLCPGKLGDSALQGQHLTTEWQLQGQSFPFYQWNGIQLDERYIKTCTQIQRQTDKAFIGKFVLYLESGLQGFQTLWKATALL